LIQADASDRDRIGGATGLRPMWPGHPNPVSGLVFAHFDWRSMFVIAALSALLWGAVWWWAIADRPSDASWLASEERDRLVGELAAERSADEAPRGHWRRHYGTPPYCCWRSIISQR
jgi:sugar phosphate permease